MEETKDMVAELESLVTDGGVETDQPSGGTVPTIEFQGKQYTPAEAQKMMDEWQANYTRTRQAETNKLRELEQQVNALAEMRGGSIDKNLVGEVAASAVSSVLNGIQNRDEFPLGEYLTGEHAKIIENKVQQRLESGKEMTKKEIENLSNMIKQMAGKLTRMELENEVTAALSKHPDASRKEVLVEAITVWDATGVKPDLMELARESHQRRSPENLDVSRLSKAQRQRIIKEEYEALNAKRKAEQPISPGSGGPPPAAKDEEYWKLVKDGSFEDLEKWAAKNIK